MPIGLETSPYMSQATPAFEGVGEAFLRARGQRDQYGLQQAQEQRLLNDALVRRKTEADANSRAAAQEIRTQGEYDIKKPGLQSDVNLGLNNNVDTYLGNETEKIKGMNPADQQPYYENIVRPNLVKLGVPPQAHPKFGTDLTTAGLNAQQRQQGRETQALREAQAQAEANKVTAQQDADQRVRDLQDQKDAAALKLQQQKDDAAAKLQYIKNQAGKGGAVKPMPPSIIKQLGAGGVAFRKGQDIQRLSSEAAAIDPNTPATSWWKGPLYNSGGLGRTIVNKAEKLFGAPGIQEKNDSLRNAVAEYKVASETSSGGVRGLSPGEQALFQATVPQLNDNTDALAAKIAAGQKDLPANEKALRSQYAGTTTLPPAIIPGAGETAFTARNLPLFTPPAIKGVDTSMTLDKEDHDLINKYKNAGKNASK